MGVENLHPVEQQDHAQAHDDGADDDAGIDARPRIPAFRMYHDLSVPPSVPGFAAFSASSG
jgi:hypothetical protein